MRKILTILSGCVLLFTGQAAAQWNLTGNANATGTSLLGTTNAVPLRLATKNTPRLTIDTLGKVGIGTTSIPAALTVKGSGGTPAATWVNSGTPLFSGFGEQTVGNADYILSMASSLANARPVFIGRRAKGTLAAPTSVANNDHIMSFLSSAYDGASFQNPAAIDFFVDGVPSAGSVPTRISFVTGSNSSNRAERLKIGNTGNVSINNNQLYVQQNTGNIGVGNILPQAKIDINGNVKIADGTQGFGKVLTSDSNGLASWKAPEVSPWTITGNNIANNNSGNVGIGNSSPAAKLDVAGNIKIADGTQGVGKVLKSDANGLASWGNIGATELFSTNPPIDYSCSDTVGSTYTGALTRMTVSGNYAYNVGQLTNNLIITDISNPAMPMVVGSITTGAGPNWVTVSGNYAYVSTNNNIQVINVSNPTSPVIAGAISTTKAPKATAISGNFLYATSDKKLLEVFNISNPTSPANVGSVVTDTGTSNIAISGNYAYLLSTNYSTGISYLQVINITNPAATVVESTVVTTYSPNALAITGTYVYVSGNYYDKVQIFDASNPASPVLSNTLTEYNANSVFISGKYAFYYSTNSNGQYIKVLDITNPTSPLSVGAIRTVNSIYGLYNSGNFIYTTSLADYRLTIFKLKSCSQTMGIDGDGNITTIPNLWEKNAVGINNYDLTGKVGIGTKTPTATLQVNGTFRLPSFLAGEGKVLTSDADGFASWANLPTETDPKIGSTINTRVPRWDGSNYKLVDGIIRDNGTNVGIGKSALGYILEVGGDASINGVTIGLGGGQKSNNTVVGTFALSNNTSGNYNSAFGLNANVSAGYLSNATALGYAAIVNANNKVRIGNTSVTLVESAAGSWTTSDGRFKTNVKEEVKGLEFIKLLRPVVYNFDAKKFDQHLKQNMPDSLRNASMEGMESAMAKATAIRQTGFIAQEVEDAAQKAGYDFNGVHTPESATDNYSISYEKMVVPLVKAVQELAAEVEKLKAMLATNNSKTVSTTTEQNVSFADASLSQNTPNPPVNDFTKINYSIPTGAAKAEMIITDNLGRNIKQIGLSTFGKGTLNVDTKGLSNGTYNYTLLVDGKLIDTKKMVVVK